MRRTTILRPDAGALLSRRARLLPALLFLLASPAGFAQAPAASAALPDCGDWRDLGLPQRIEAPAQPAEALLLIEEIGWALEARRPDEAEFRAFDQGPPRLRLLALGAGETLELRAADPQARVRVQRHCKRDPVLNGVPACTPPAAEGSLCAALEQHAEATRLSREGASAAAQATYLRAAEAWAAAGDPLRAAAARYGAASRLAMLDRHREALDAAPDIAALAAGAAPRPQAQAYYRLRIEADRCLWLRRIGEPAAAERCLTPVPEAYAALGEHSEAGNAWLNLAAMQMEDGSVEAARALLQRALAQPRLSPLVRGRLGVLQARLHYEDGRVSEALRAAEQALDTLQQTNDWAWQVHALLRLADLHRDLGAQAEARNWVERALQQLEGREAPRIEAKARLLKARILETFDEPAAAAAQAAAARARLQADGNPLAAAHAGLQLARLAPGAIDPGLLAAEIESLGAPPALRQPWALLQAEHALAAGRPQEAAALLPDAAQFSALELRQRRLAVAVALQLADGRGAEALADIEAEVSRLQALVARADNGGLRHLLSRRMHALRALWIDSWIALPASQRPGADAVWSLLLSTHAPRQLRGLAEPGALPPQEARALMLALRGEDAGLEAPALEADVDLLRRLLAEADSAAAQAPATLSAAQARLGEDAVWLGWGFGERHALLLEVRGGDARVHLLGEAAPLRRDLHRLDAGLRRPDSDRQQLEDSAVALGPRLLPATPLAGTQRLYALMDGALPAVPLALLHWPGDAQPLIERLAISRVEDLPERGDRLGRAQRALVLYAAGGDSARRPQLRNAPLESQLLGRALPELSVEPAALTGAAQLREALGTAATWVHVAAHGETRRGLQGYAGLWLDASSADPRLGFVSWLDLLGRPVRSPLVVLNACELAASGDASVGGSASFATALSAAGAAHVIAGQWAVSDGAAGLWVEAMYAGLAEHGEPARALQRAQLRLRDSRAYRHPFYWAGLVHLQR